MRPEFASTGPLLIAVCVVMACGCATSKNVELLESRLTAEQDKLLSIERELVDARREIRSLQDTLVATRKKAAAAGEPIQVGPRPVSLVFSTLLTGGIDEDGHPGDEAVRAIIQPVSADGGTIPAEGQLSIELLDVSAPADRRTRGSWTFAGQQLRDLWSSGLFSTGYQLELSPDDGALPDGALLIARFTTPEGEQLEAVHTVKLSPDEQLAFRNENQIVPVSAERTELSDADLSRDLPGTLPIRRPPSDAAERGTTNPFAEVMNSSDQPIRTSDAWTDQTIPVLR